jgi:hypothetical protein
MHLLDCRSWRDEPVFIMISVNFPTDSDGAEIFTRKNQWISYTETEL